MALMRRRVGGYICSELCGSVMNQRLYSSRVDWKQLRPMILKRIKNRAKEYPIKRMIPVAEEVVKAREIVTKGVSTLLQVVPVHSCKFCPEVHIGVVGHEMQSCHGFKRMIKNQPHKWGPGCLNDILVPVESFHLENTFQDEIKHDQRFDFPRVPAVLELCHQAGADIPDEVWHRSGMLSATVRGNDEKSAAFLPEELRFIGQRTIEAWERLRLGVTKLLLVYPSKVCEHCSEVHVGLSGHKARMCGVFKFEGWRGKHKWKKAGVDDLVPPKIVWHQRPHDPPVLVDGGRDYYGHAPAVIELCMQVGARAPPKYHCMMKAQGLAPPIK
uniref:APO domain-containing protein n=1 Tax=Oryza punctata TaxID=4537 RepID=A0A0E0KVJ7_ORYPU